MKNNHNTVFLIIYILCFHCCNSDSISNSYKKDECESILDYFFSDSTSFLAKEYELAVCYYMQGDTSNALKYFNIINSKDKCLGLWESYLYLANIKLMNHEYISSLMILDSLYQLVYSQEDFYGKEYRLCNIQEIIDSLNSFEQITIPYESTCPHLDVYRGHGYNMGPIDGIKSIQDNLLYPKDALADSIQGTVVISVEVSVCGEVISCVVLKGLEYDSMNIAAELAILITQFQIGYIRDLPAEYLLSIPLIFRIE